MTDTDGPKSKGPGSDAGGEHGPGIGSRFRLVLVAAQRSKQLQRGARARIGADPKRGRSTSIALEEVRRGLVSFVANTEDAPREGGDAQSEVRDAAAGGV